MLLPERTDSDLPDGHRRRLTSCACKFATHKTDPVLSATGCESVNAPLSCQLLADCSSQTAFASMWAAYSEDWQNNDQKFASMQAAYPEDWQNNDQKFASMWAAYSEDWQNNDQKFASMWAAYSEDWQINHHNGATATCCRCMTAPTACMDNSTFRRLTAAAPT